MSFARGFQVGWSAVDDALKEKEKRELREGLKRAGALDQQTNFTKRQATSEEFDRAQAEAQALGQQDAVTFGLKTEDEMEMYAPAAPSRTAQVTAPDGYSLGGLTRETPFTQPEIQRARTEEMARVYEQQGMPEEAMRMRQLAQQQELTGLQLGQARRQEDYNTALQKINKQKFADPTERTTAILAATEAFDPAIALKLRNDYTQAELNEITLKAKKFEQNYTEARAKGVDSVISWYDSVNNGFTLRREGNKIIQTDTAGNQRVFAQGTDDQIMMRMDALAKPGGFLELAKTEADMARSEEQTLLAKAQRLGLPAAATGANLDRQIKLAEQLRKQVDDIQKQLENTTPNSKRFENLSKQLDDKNADLYRVTQSVQSGLYSGPSAKVGNTINVRGTTYKKVKSGPDSDQTTWEPVEGGAAAPARGLTPGAAPASSTAPREQAPVPAGIGRMGQSYGRLTPEAIVVEGVRRGDPRAIQEQQRRREIEEAYRTQTPGYNPADVF
jgi:hypothetical protein